MDETGDGGSRRISADLGGSRRISADLGGSRRISADLAPAEDHSRDGEGGVGVCDRAGGAEGGEQAAAYGTAAPPQLILDADVECEQAAAAGVDRQEGHAILAVQEGAHLGESRSI